MAEPPSHLSFLGGGCRGGAAELLPAVIARCETRRDVQAAMRTARAHGLAITVDNGVRDGVRRAPVPGELIIDLSAMRDVAIDPANEIAIVAGGATINDVVTAAAARDLFAVTGIYGAMRMASLLFDGYGPLLGRYGRAADNVLKAEIVLNNGEHVVASVDGNGELFRALSAGDTDLGVVTSLHLRLHALPSLLSGMIFYAWSDAHLVLRGYSAMAAAAPECLTICAGVVSQPNDRPLLFVAPSWCGEPGEGTRVFAALQTFGNPLAANVGPTNVTDLVARYGRYLAPGSNRSIRRRRLHRLSDRVISALIDGARAGTSPPSAIVLHHFRGAAGPTDFEAAGFGLWPPHFLAEAVASSERLRDGV